MGVRRTLLSQDLGGIPNKPRNTSN